MLTAGPLASGPHDQNGPSRGRVGCVGEFRPESRIQIGLPEKNRKGLWNFGRKIEFEFKSKDIFKVKLQFKLKRKFKTFTNGNLGFVSRIQIKTRTLNQRVSNKMKQDFEIQSLNLLEIFCENSKYIICFKIFTIQINKCWTPNKSF
jgi:hypothetical protein